MNIDSLVILTVLVAFCHPRDSGVGYLVNCSTLEIVICVG